MLRRLRTERTLRPERASPIDRADLIAWYRRNRERSRALFDLLIDESAHYSEPIPSDIRLSSTRGTSPRSASIRW